jgi:hypothetical protein
MSPERIKVIEKIRAAFSNVLLEDGIGLWEAQGIDDYEDESVCAQYREKDEKEDWTKIPPDVLLHCHSSLSFFDPKGMRFHLPAFLIGELNGTVPMETHFHLIELDDFKMDKFSLLSTDQKSAVVAFLRELLKDPDSFFDETLYALENYWTK